MVDDLPDRPRGRGAGQIKIGLSSPPQSCFYLLAAPAIEREGFLSTVVGWLDRANPIAAGVGDGQLAVTRIGLLWANMSQAARSKICQACIEVCFGERERIAWVTDNAGSIQVAAHIFNRRPGQYEGGVIIGIKDNGHIGARLFLGQPRRSAYKAMLAARSLTLSAQPKRCGRGIPFPLHEDV